MFNVLEVAVRALQDELLLKYPQFCACERCRDDALTYALNHIRPRYVTGSRALGVALTNLELSRDQTRAELLVAIFDALRRVAAKPSHGPEQRISAGAATQR